MAAQLQLLVRQREDDPDLTARLERTLKSVWRLRDIVARMKHITRLELVDQSPHLPAMLDLKNSTSESATWTTRPRC